MDDIYRKLIEDTIEAIEELIHHWHPRHDAADYCCEFCHKTSDTNQGRITHRDNCEGRRLLQHWYVILKG